MASIAKISCIVLLMCGLFAARSEAAHKVLFDTGHGEQFLIGKKGPLQLSELAGIFRETGIQVAILDKMISDASLADVDGLVISGAFVPFQPEEVEAIVSFMRRGGRLSVMLHIAPPLESLLDRLGIMHTNGVIEERENIINGNPHDFRVSRFGNHPVLKGITEFSLFGAWGVLNADERGKAIASTSPNAWIDLHHDKIQTKDETDSFGVVCAGDLGKGGFLVFGDDAIFQNKFLDSNNKAIAVNLADWFNERL